MIIRWYPGEWISGQPRPLTWMPATPVHPYVWRPSLSFIDLENYVTATTEAVFLKKIVSQTICQTNVINSALSTLACDCLAVDSERSMEKHYVSVFKIKMYFIVFSSFSFCNLQALPVITHLLGLRLKSESH